MIGMMDRKQISGTGKSAFPPQTESSYYQSISLVFSNDVTRSLEQCLIERPSHFQNGVYYDSLMICLSDGSIRPLEQHISPATEFGHGSMERKRQTFYKLIQSWKEKPFANPNNHLGSRAFFTPPEAWNRRRDCRIQIDQPVRFRSADSLESLIGSVSNMSAGGIFIQSAQTPCPGSLVAFGFFIHHGGNRYMIRCMGQVIRTVNQGKMKQSGFGLKYIEPPSEMINTIHTIVTDIAKSG
jgi:hypothetical protein